MSSTYSPDLRIELIGTGDQAGVWGNTTNNNLGTFIENAVAGYTSVSISASPQALTANDGAADEARFAAIALTTVTGANFTVCIPPNSKLYTFYNASSYIATVSNSTVKNGITLSGGTTVAIPAGKTMAVWSDGTNVSQQTNHLISPTMTSPTMTAPVLGTPASGTLTNATGLPVATGISGLGSGVATFLTTPSSANLAAAVTDETGSGALVFATSPTLVTPALGTPASGVLTNVTGLPIDGGTTGTLPVNRGGTGQSSLTSNAVLTGNGTSGVSGVSPSTTQNVLASNGTAWTSAALADLTPFTRSLSGNNGYQKLPGGLILQWGYGYNIPYNTTITLDYNIPFTSTVVYVNMAITDFIGANEEMSVPFAYPISVTQFVLRNTDGDTGIGSYRWFAVGW